MVIPHLPVHDSFAAAGCRVLLRTRTTRDSMAMALDGTIAKSAADSSRVDGTMDPGAVERGSLFWEAVLIDSDNANADSPSGYLERRLFTFNAPVDPAPVDPVP